MSFSWLIIKRIHDPCDSATPYWTMVSVGAHDPQKKIHGAEMTQTAAFALPPVPWKLPALPLTALPLPSPALPLPSPALPLPSPAFRRRPCPHQPSSWPCQLSQWDPARASRTQQMRTFPPERVLQLHLPLHRVESGDTCVKMENAISRI